MNRIKNISNIVNRRYLCTSKSLSSKHNGIIEIRTYQAKPELHTDYKNKSALIAPLRKQYMQDKWKLYLQAETGYGTLQDFIHIYHYENGLQQRSDIRKNMSNDSKWNEFLNTSRQCLVQQKSEIFAPVNLNGIHINYWKNDNYNNNNNNSVYEIRHYQLIPGYNVIPSMIDIFSKGLPDKLNCCSESLGKLILLAHSDITVLNQFIEIWRYPSQQKALEHRIESRKAIEWRKCIESAAKLTVTFQNRYMIPLNFSPLQ
jgi:hypothetical protein